MGADQLWGYIIGGLGALSIVLSLVRNNKTDGSWIGTVNAKLDTIMAELARLSDVRERVAVAETTLKSLHKRVDALEIKINKED